MSNISDAIGWAILAFILVAAFWAGAIILVGWVLTLLIWPVFGISLSIWQGAGLVAIIAMIGSILFGRSE